MQQELTNFYQFLCHVTLAVIFQVKSWRDPFIYLFIYLFIYFILTNFYQFLYPVTPVVIFQVESWPDPVFD